ncbi:MFS transporter [Peptococcus simiae]|uniref:MFS transporter n=1 Tax=Peptococcus simiae TaxID=1643805 RepID=UPI003980F633
MKGISQRALVVALTSFILFTANYTQYQLSPIANDIMALLNIDTQAFTAAFTAPMIPAVVFSLVSGLLVDRFGVRLILGMAVTLMAIGTVARMAGDTYSIFFWAMLFSGFGPAFINANAAKIFGAHFSPSRAHRMMGLAMALGCLGMTVGMATTALLPSIRTAYWIASVLAVIAVPAWWCLIAPTKVLEEPAGVSLKSSLQAVIHHRGVWVTGLALCFIIGAALLINATMPTALATKGFSPASAGLYSAMISIGAIIGSFSTPYIAGWLGGLRRAIVLIVALGALALAFAWQLPAGVLLAAGLFLCGFTTSGVFPLLLAIPLSLKGIGMQFAGTAGGLIASLQLLGAVLIPGYIILPLTDSAPGPAFLAAGACMALAVLAMIFLPALEEEA